MDTRAHDSPPSLLAEVQALRSVYDLDKPAQQQPMWLWLFTVLVARLVAVLAAASAWLSRDPVLSIAEHHHAMAMGGNPRALAMALGAASDRAASAEAENRALRAALDPSPAPAFFPDNTTFAEEAEEAERKRLETQAPPASAPGPEPVAEPAAKPQAPAGRKVMKGRAVHRGG
jgi:hypothetical protein